ncbi:unnamed protein product [Sphenostylis stenocarpa]|uniref:Uncharacterized protein n=1 Tax=Sphenostylis stenocarpa TaxID=92480 RepID=A0AA86ST01_9FABA|nr:unnamed protein product [Sphenostylis stenocarpa]
MDNVCHEREGSANWVALKHSESCVRLCICNQHLKFFSSTSTRPSSLVSWLSLISHLASALFSPYTSSYKKFKGNFFKVVFQPPDRDYFFDGDQPKFPLCWTHNPLRFKNWPCSEMSLEDAQMLGIFDQIPAACPLENFSESIYLHVAFPTSMISGLGAQISVVSSERDALRGMLARFEKENKAAIAKVAELSSLYEIEIATRWLRSYSR